MPEAVVGARRDALLALALAVLAFGLYAFTLCRDVYWYDSAEYVTAAFTLGVPHPPGYPLYTLLAHAFLALPFAPALAVNMMSAVFAACAVALCYRCARELGASVGGALGAATLLAGGPSYWLNATVAEVYAPALCCTLGVLWLLLRARIAAGHRLSWFAAGLAGLGLGVHYSLATLGLGFVWLVLATARSRDQPRLRTAGVHAALVLCGYAAAFSYVWLRAGSDVVPNHAYPPSAARFLWLLAGGNYRLWFEHDALFGHVARALGLLANECALPGACLGLIGLGMLFVRERSSALALGLCVLGNFGFFFRYRVDDLEVFLLPSAALLCICAALGIDALAAALVATLRAPRLAMFAPYALVLFAGVRIAQGYAAHDLSTFSAAFDYGARLATQLPADAVILNYTTPEEWKRHAVFGMYFQNVLGQRYDVQVVDNADRPVLDRLLREGRPTFLYTPVAHVVREYIAAPDGDLYRLVRRR